jgi:hypothetical protein
VVVLVESVDLLIDIIFDAKVGLITNINTTRSPNNGNIRMFATALIFMLIAMGRAVWRAVWMWWWWEDDNIGVLVDVHAMVILVERVDLFVDVIFHTEIGRVADINTASAAY